MSFEFFFTKETLNTEKLESQNSGLISIRLGFSFIIFIFGFLLEFIFYYNLILPF